MQVFEYGFERDFGVVLIKKVNIFGSKAFWTIANGSHWRLDQLLESARQSVEESTQNKHF